MFFHTNATRRRLMAGGFTEEQADTAVTVAADVAGQMLATKADLREAIQQQTIRFGTMLAVAVTVLGGIELITTLSAVEALTQRLAR